MNNRSLVGPLLAILATLLLVTLCWAVTQKREPQVVVQMPKDAKPLESLAPVVSSDTKLITEQRAVLWWTVYNASRRDSGSRLAADAADRAVDKAYGPLPSR